MSQISFITVYLALRQETDLTAFQRLGNQPSLLAPRAGLEPATR